ncbi:ShlB/FhaC/HecB family hemolysin secretion/activation protein [Novosphingobium aquimarinum]|uniref:ShlB/FhaC/HecB family hemolysin secretion/activation protein n=1 Tax=Novosphingobium aquimarinum TaxID=2682494 RepID=UPI001E468EA9|nr:ShlB/FhaC/HecB family hemolysin secretion/activation protein [Novosphingobium aquimarinum]
MARVRHSSSFRLRHASCVALAVAGLAGAALPAAAQQAEAPPTREELGIDTSQEPGTQGPRLSVEGDIERGPCPFADPSFANTKVTFARVEFPQLTVISPTQLDSTWQEFAGREVPVSTLCEVRDRAATILRSLGYLAAVQIPPQRIEPMGTVRLDVLIARLVEVQARGDIGPSGKLIERHLAKLAQGQYFNALQAERHLLLLGDLPGYTVRLKLRPANGAPGEVVGDVLVERTPVQFAVGALNYGSKAVGPTSLSAQLVLNDLTGLGDRTIVSGLATIDFEEQLVAQIGHDFALNADGLRLGGRLLYAKSEPSSNGGVFSSETFVGSLELRYPLLRSRLGNVYAAGGFDIVDQSVDFGAVPFTKDKLRVLFARIEGDATDADSNLGRDGYSYSEPRWRVSGALELRQGLSGLGASNDCSPVSNCVAPNTPISRFFADPSAFVARFDARAEYRPTPELAISAEPRIQYSPDALLGFEQYSVSNYTNGRGYDPGEVIGDSGIGSSFEISYGKIIPQSLDSFSIQPFAFFDTAWVWTNRDRGTIDDPVNVQSAGGGVRGRWGNRIQASLTVAAPLKTAPDETKRGDVRVLFNVRALLAPWGR